MIVKVNQTFLTWTGHRREDLVGRKRFQDLLTAGGRIFHETHYAPLLRMQGAVREIAVEIVCADGGRLPVLINSVLRKDAAGKPLLTRTTVFNATDRKEYERELLRARQKAEQADKAKADFISMISHEIRTPLNAIMGVGHLLDDDRPLAAAAEVRPHPPLVLGEPAGPGQRDPRLQQDRGGQGVPGGEELRPPAAGPRNRRRPAT